MIGAGEIDRALGLAVACLNGRDWHGAEAGTGAVLAAAPGHPVALYLRGLALSELGRWVEAERALSEAWRSAPDQLDIVFALITAQAKLNRHEDLIVTTGDALRQGREQIDPASHAELHYRRGSALKALRRYDQALVELDLALADAPNPATIQRARASVLQHLRRYPKAADALRTVLAREPLDLATHVQLNELIHRQQLPGAPFLGSYDDAARAVPASPVPLVAQGHALLTVGRTAEAYDTFAAALGLASDHPAALAGSGRALERLGEIDRAAAAHALSIRAGGDDVGALVDCAAFHLRQGDARDAFDLAERAVARQPDSQGALAMLGLCHRALGDDAEYRLNDYDGLVRVFDLAPPRGFADMASFNAELAAYLDALHGDLRENFTQTLRGGTRLYDSVFGNGHDLADRLRERIDEALARYVAELPDDAAHPFTGRRSGALSYVSSWSSRMGAAGYHLNHIHPEGWLSSAYYVAVPDVVADEGRQEGWLTLGQPTPDFGELAPRRTIRPHVGRLVLFPSYVWHGTTPFRSDERRMTIAFDALPGR